MLSLQTYRYFAPGNVQSCTDLIHVDRKASAGYTFAISDNIFEDGGTSCIARPHSINFQGDALLHPGHKLGREGGGRRSSCSQTFSLSPIFVQVQSFLLAAISPYLASLLSQVGFHSTPCSDLNSPCSFLE